MAAGAAACLLDAYDTIVHTDFSAHRGELPALAGIPADALWGEFRHLGAALSTGQLSMTEAFARTLRACGAEPRPGLARELADRSRELLLASARLYDDVLPFLRSLRARGVRTAVVSNCDENTRPLLETLGVAAVTDALVLSFEVGAVKPAAPIFVAALNRLGVAAGAAVFVDNIAAYCAGAAALGIRAVQMVRDDGHGDVTSDFKVVRSLGDVEALL